LDFFTRHHSDIRAVVIVTDAPWCAHELAPLPRNSFPFWLYGDSTLEYAGRLFSWRALDHAFQRIQIGLGKRPRVAPDGFFNYEEFFPRDRHPVAAPQPGIEKDAADKIRDNFPLAALLDGTIKKLPAEVPVILAAPPTFYTALPRAGGIEAAELEACKMTFKRIVAGRLRSNFIDYRIDNALTRDPESFVDLIHYRAKLARKIEQGIAASIQSGSGTRIDF
jgi:hypothetical protein